MRPKENRSPQFKRVDSVEVFKPGSDGFKDAVCPEGIVYDLEVEDNHNYFSNGILVHNCSAFPKPSLRAKRLKERVVKTPLIMLSGSPSPESFSQLYHPLWVSDYSPWSRYRNFYAWAKDYVSVYTKDIAGRPKKFYDRADKERILSDIEPFMVSFTQEQAGFTSMVEEEVLTVRMPDNIRQAYHQMSKDRIVMFSDCEVPASNKADVINKLSQLCGGTIKVDDSYTKILSTYKAKYIKDNFDQGKISIFYKYQAEKLILEKVFPDCTDDPETFNTTDVRYFIGQIQSVREGVNLKESDCIVMYNIDFSATSYIQAKARLQTKDRVKASKVYWLFTEGGIETYVYKAVRAKRNFTSRFYATQTKPQYA